MRLTIVSLASLALAGCCAVAPPAVTEAPALGLPVELSAEGWSAIEEADPRGAAAIDGTNARWLCGYAPAAALTAEERAAICGDLR